MNKKILIVDDEEKLLKVVNAYMKEEGFRTRCAGNGRKALELVEAFNPDLLILDLMLPEISGEEVCQKIRHKSELPILMLTAKSQEEDKINGFNFGADDYLVKPFSPKVLVARVKAILRRSDYQADKAEVIIYNKGELKIYPSKMLIFRDDKKIKLTNTEFNIFYILAHNSGQVFSREQLAEKVMGLEFKGFDRTIDAHIKNIRKKLDLKKNEYINTVYGAGYKFVGENSE
jgi:DNA-binding response OmpR family regulator